MRYTRDGAPIPAHVPSKQRGGYRQHFNNFKLKKGTVIDIVYPEDPRSKSRARIEFIVNIGGRHVPGVTDLRNRGAIYNYSEKTRNIPKKSLENKIDASVFSENLDHEFVYVLFLNGDEDYPIIIGSDEHPRHSSYKKSSKADGDFDKDEFLGIEVKIDKDSNYTVAHLGRKDKDGVIENPDAVGSIIKLHGNGDYEIDSYGTDGTSDLRMKFTKANKKFELYANDNSFIIEGDTVKAENNQGKIFFLDDFQILGAGTEPILLGDTLVAGWDTYLTASIAGILPGSPGQNAASLLAVKTAMTTLQGILATFKSANSKTD